MASDDLTDRAFWLEYWANFVATPESELHWLSSKLTNFPGPGSSFLEVGGFPGRNAAYFNKYHGYNVTIVDFIAPDTPIRSVERVNGISQGTIKSIETDFLSFHPESRFDVVFSGGFIEHFSDVKSVIAKHVECLNEGGTLCITLPNLRGISGWTLKAFDRKTYDAHNISVMDIPLLRKLCTEVGLHSFEVFYYGTPWLWIDHPDQVHPLFRLVISVINRLISKLPWKQRWLSPHIVIIGKK